MMRSLYSGVTGLRNHQTRMDVIGNNISNVNTVAYKGSRAVFQDIFSQTLSPASGANGTITGGVNPKQIGLGSTLATIDVLNTPSATQYTGNTLDLAIEGDGYFTLSANGSLSYTRAGNFYADQNNNLVSANGAFVQGYRVDVNGNFVDLSGNPLAFGASPIMQDIFLDPAYKNITIDSNGKVNAQDAAGNTAIIGQLVLATFANNNALEKVGSNTYHSSVNSGNPVYVVPGDGGSGNLKPGALEMSNVDLANEFSNLITTQRAFQANARIITTSDEVLMELVNLKR